MPIVLPFRAVRPTVSDGDLAERLSPPYDVISAAERERLAHGAHNPVHLILPEDDRAPGSRYASAGRRLGFWLADGALARDPAPAFYPYEQRFTHAGTGRTRRGFFGLLELREFSQGGVFAHEQTFAAPKEDRFRLLEATRANLSPVFVLYEDEGGQIRELLEASRTGEAIGEAATAEGEERLWTLGGEAVSRVALALARQGLVFADGHHRYESALRYRRERRAVGPEAAYPQAYDFMLACFVEAGDLGLLILPTHRVVRGLPGFTGRELASRLAPAFANEELGEAADAGDAARRAGRYLAAHPRGALALVSAGERTVHGFALDPRMRESAFAGSSVPPVLHGLDVVVLHELVLARLLGIAVEKLAGQNPLEYVKSAEEAARLGGPGGGATAAFLLNPTPVEQVLEVARGGGRMPQKSTYFLPKVTTGWVYHVHGSPEEVWGADAEAASWWPSAAPTA